jgi:hypothetical protein
VAVQPIKVEGLREARARLKALGDGQQKMIRLALNDAGAVIVDNTAPWIPSRTGRTRSTLKVRSTQSKAVVVGGGNRAPWYPWLDFGGAVGRKGSVYRKFYREGRFAWRTLGKRRTEVVEAVDTALVNAVREAGFEVT